MKVNQIVNNPILINYRETNKYGYGQDVVKIACDAVDSVKCLVDQVLTY